MKKLDVAAWARIAWVVTAFVVLGIGVGLIWWPASTEVGQRRAHARELYNEANDLDEATRRAEKLREAQQRVQADLQQLGGIRSEGAVTAALLRLIHDESKQTGVEVRELSPDAMVRSSTSATAPLQAGKAPADSLVSYDLAIGIRGPYRNVVRLLADLPRHDVLIDIHDVQIASNQSNHKPPILDVTLHSSIYRIASVPMLEDNRVRALR